MTFIADNSITMAWCMPDEHTPELLELLESAKTAQIVVPAIWPLEFCNALGMAKRKGRTSPSIITAALELIAALDIKVAPGWVAEDFAFALALMEQHSLTSYDASYLALAKQMSLPLATLDGELRSAASNVGLSLLL